MTSSTSLKMSLKLFKMLLITGKSLNFFSNCLKKSRIISKSLKSLLKNRNFSENVFKKASISLKISLKCHAFSKKP
jgi:hypothetical protein